MTARQWLILTVVVILNIIVFGALLGNPARPVEPTPTWTPPPTFTPMPLPTATSILMPTLPPPPTPFIHTVAVGETLEAVAAAYGVSVPDLEKANGLAPRTPLRPGQLLIVPLAAR